METPHIAVMYTDEVPAEVITEFREQVETEHLAVAIHQRPSGGVYAIPEWFYPTALAVFIGQAYFTAFLGEMGKDHYNLLKAGLKKLWQKAIGPSAPQVYAFGSKGKVSKDQPYSLYFAIHAEAGNGFSFKLLIQKGLSEDKYTELVEGFLLFLEEHYQGNISQEFIEKSKTILVVGKTILLTYNFDLKVIEQVNPTLK
ncbi:MULTISPECIES: hypothetical protein [unclassified Halomonas]|uniref:hypothetical protein n=1 Tax=unclassified Halomonas TaxID=2609666 RepID=UPI000555ED5D|nr:MULTISPECIES: hypothetical protein [unclassified Halomonas]CEP34356.1 Putative uncharacterized protein [Halomonas sp. R57-5]